MIYVSEIFGPTIQGEGPHVGAKCIFVRVAGCDFKCSFCDSKFSWDTGIALPIKEDKLIFDLMSRCEENNVSRVILTGGNPCIYNFEKLIRTLTSFDIKVDVETQGSIYPEWLNLADLVVISPKPPSSGMKDVYLDLENYLKKCDFHNKICIKIPIFNEEDFQFAIRYYELSKKYRLSFYLSVGNSDVSEEGSIKDRILKSYEDLINRVNHSVMRDVYILPQVHTLVWGNKQGV